MKTRNDVRLTAMVLGCATASVCAYAGGAPDLPASEADMTVSFASSSFGWSVAGVPTPGAIAFNDGLIVGAPNSSLNGASSGSAFLYEESDGELILVAGFHGLGPSQSLGSAVADAGMIDLNTGNEVVIGAPSTSGGAGPIQGQAYLGREPSDTITSLTLGGGPVVGGRLGHSVAPLGDIDFDFIAEFVLGAPNDLVGTGKGHVRIHTESGDEVFSIEGEADRDMFGYSVAGMPNQLLFLVGAPYNDGAAEDAGRAYLYNGVSRLLLRSFDGPAADSHFGWSVDLIDDLTGDNFPEVLVGAPVFIGGSVQPGTAWLYDGDTGALLHSYTGVHSDELFGFDVSGAGDVDEDGFEDFLIGAPNNNTNGQATGRVYLYSGQTGDLLFTFTGPSTQSVFGWSVSGRVNLEEQPIPGKILPGYDGADVIIGAPGAGRAYVYNSSTMFADPLPCNIPEDLNGDGVIGSADMAILLGAWGSLCFPPFIPCPADLNGDNQVNSGDLALLLGSWGACG